MKIHGIELGSLSRLEIEAAKEAIILIRSISRPMYGTKKMDDGWRILTRAGNYLQNITRTKVPRTFNRNLAYPVGRDADGKRLCRWCRKPVAKGRQAYCSDTCRTEIDIRTSAGSLRYHVKQRDKGVCAKCGLDTARLKRIFDHATRSFYELRHGIGSTNGSWWPGEFRRDSILFRMGFNHGTSFWEADHIVEVSAGGESTLENTQTLCVPCHKEKTKRMHHDRKQERRDRKRSLLPSAISGHPGDAQLKLASAC